MSDDTISRKATIDAMENVDWYHISKDGRLVHGANSKEDEPLYKAKDVYAVLNTMPSAQPETHDKRTETHACDCISRKEAIDAIEEMQMPMRLAMVKYFMIGAAIFITILMYACCVAGSEADDREERWFYER